jgi:O-methyltransferase involved in polyketide biosynthesis
MAYLNQAVTVEAQSYSHVRLISLGAGYDARSIRWLNESPLGVATVVQCYDIDLPETVTSKQRLFDQRLSRRYDFPLKLPTLIGLDLNDTDQVYQELQKILNPSDDDEGKKNATLWHTIFVAEGVLMYLDEGKAAAVLKACAEACPEGGTASLCFADRLVSRDKDTVEDIQAFLANAGDWNLTEWAPHKKANAAHMGRARKEVPQSHGGGTME